MTLIVINLDLQVMGCTVCKEVVEIPRPLMRDQHGLLQLQQDTLHDHRECAANPTDLKTAIRDRMYRKRVERELAKAEGRGGRGRGDRPRCEARREGRPRG